MAEGGPSRKRAFPEDSDTQQKIRFPKGKKAKTRAYVVDDPTVEVVPGWKDPRQAAKARAMARTRFTGGLLEDDREEPDDISRVEIKYKDNGTFVDDGVPIDPFNLVQEREEGYFDKNGNYVEYISEEIRDAWLDTVDANRHIAAPTNDDDPPRKNKKEDDVQLSSGDVEEIKRRIAHVLLPGETVLQALRRLKGDDRKVKMSDENKHVFDQLTEDAMHLLENGDYNVYNVRKPSPPPQVAVDMFGDEDPTTINPAPSSDMNTGNIEASDSDYVYDEASGYYYSNSLGYYFDPSTGLYCYASTGQWYSYNEESGAYEECQQQQQQQGEEVEATGSSAVSS